MVKGYQSKRDKVCSEFYDTTKNKIRQPRNVVQRKTMDIMLGYKGYCISNLYIVFI